MNKTEKNAAVVEMAESLGKAQNAFVVGFSGITVGAVTELRRQVRESKSKYVVVKNTLATRAIQSTPLEPLTQHFTGPTAVAYNEDSPVELAKVLTNFAKTNPTITFKGAVVEGRAVAVSEIKTIAELPSREQMIARLLGILQSPMRRLATVLNGPARNLVMVLSQIAEQKGKSAPAADAASGA